MNHHANIGEAIRLLEQASDLVAQPDMTGDFNRLIREARDMLEPSKMANDDAVHAWVLLDGAAPLAGPGVGAAGTPERLEGLRIDEHYLLQMDPYRDTCAHARIGPTAHQDRLELE